MTPEYLHELADLADPDELWRLPPFKQKELPPEKRQQLDAGVALRRHAAHISEMRESTDSNTTMPVVAHLTDERGKGVVLADGLPEFYMLAYSTAPLVKLSDAQAVTAALQREVEELRAVTCQCVQNNARMNAAQMEADELRKLLIDIRAALPALRDNGVAKLYALAIDNALASKAEVPNGGSLAQ